MISIVVAPFSGAMSTTCPPWAVRLLIAGTRLWKVTLCGRSPLHGLKSALMQTFESSVFLHVVLCKNEELIPARGMFRIGELNQQLSL